MSWYLNRALSNFRTAVNAAFPRRDKTSDGTIGDPAHQATSSDHNPDPGGEPDAGSVDAWDMDVDLNGPGQPYAADVERLKAVFQSHESSRYWIHNRQIASRSDGWIRRAYDGPNPHDKHVHWNTRESHETSTAPWQIGDDDMATAAEVWADGNAQYLIWRADALAWMRPAYAGGPEKGKPVELVKTLLAQQSALTALTSQVGGLAAAFTALAGQLSGVGGSLDTAAVLARIDQRATEEVARDTAHAAEVAALRQELVALQQKLAAYRAAEAAAARAAADQLAP